MVKFPSREKKSNNRGKQMAGLAAGAALVGAVGTALFTPKTGKQVRKDIIDGSKAATKKVEKTVKSVEQKLHKTPAKTPVASKSKAKTASKTVKKTSATPSRTTKTAVKPVK